MKTLKFIQPNIRALYLSAIVLSIAGCATYDEVESQAVTSALDFSKADKFKIVVPNTTTMDTAFSQDLRGEASEALIDKMELEGFDYVGEKDPDLSVSFATYVASQSGYINTALPVVNRIVERETVPNAIGGTSTQTRETITTTKTSEPIYVSGPSRIFILDVFDAETEVLLWRAYTIDNTTGLDKESLLAAIDKLVDRLEEES